MAHSILFKKCGADHMTRGRLRPVDRIVVHYTSTLASARNNAIYFSRNERQGSSAHYFVDDITVEIYQSVAEADTAWHAGDWDMNCRSIGIEVVVGKIVWLVGALMRSAALGRPGDPPLRRDGQDLPGALHRGGPLSRTQGEDLRGARGGRSGSALGGDEVSGDVGELARRVIVDETGNGDARHAALGSRYAEVQAEVNRLLGGGSDLGGGSSGA